MQRVLRRLFMRGPAVLLVIVAAYLVVGAAILHGYHDQINPDGTAYLDIAKLYLSGHLKEAINGYWSPLLSWLLVPLLKLGISGLLAAKIATLACGVVALAGFWLLTRNLQPRWTGVLFLAAYAVAVMAWAVGTFITPDIITLGLILIYLAVLVNPNYLGSKRTAILAGVLGALMYYTKSYGWPFFAIHFAGYHAWMAYRQRTESRQWLRHLAWGATAFLILTLPWAALISVKYHRPTLGTSASYNFQLAGPIGPGQPMFTQGLLKPLPHAASVWTDPSYLTVRGYGPGLRHNTLFLAGQVWKNLETLVAFLQAWWFMALAVIAAGTVYGLSQKAFPPIRARLGLYGYTAVIYLGGYLLVFIEDRYLWPIYSLAVLAAVVLLEAAYRFRWLGTLAFSGAAIIMALGFAVPSVVTLVTDNGAGNLDMAYARQIKTVGHGQCTAVASNNDWEDSLYVAYDLGCAYYGALAPGALSYNRTSLARYHVQYFLDWTAYPTELGPSGFSSYHVVKRVAGINLTVLETSASR